MTYCALDLFPPIFNFFRTHSRNLFIYSMCLPSYVCIQKPSKGSKKPKPRPKPRPTTSTTTTTATPTSSSSEETGGLEVLEPKPETIEPSGGHVMPDIDCTNKDFIPHANCQKVRFQKDCFFFF